MTSKSTFKKDKENRETKISSRYTELGFQGLKPTEIETILMKEFDIYSRSTIWAIRKRVNGRQTKKD